MNRFRFTIKAWPVIAFATIGLCFITQLVAGLLGIDLPEQSNVALMRKCAGWNWKFALLVLQVVVLMPAIEECVFRGVLFKWQEPKRVWLAAVTSSSLFSAAHYLFQPWPDSAFIALFFFGLAQCWLYKKTGALRFAILNHALFNVLNLMLLFVLPENAI